MGADELGAVIRAAVREERDRCTNLADGFALAADAAGESSGRVVGEAIADAIRRGDPAWPRPARTEVAARRGCRVRHRPFTA